MAQRQISAHAWTPRNRSRARDHRAPIAASGSSRFPIVRSSVGPAIACRGRRVTCSPRAAVSKAIAPERPQAAISSPLLSARCNHAHGRGETIALGLGSADAIGKAIARRIPPASSCMTTAQPGLCSRPPSPAGQLLAWRSNRGASGRPNGRSDRAGDRARRSLSGHRAPRSYRHRGIEMSGRPGALRRRAPLRTRYVEFNITGS
jgi:hypothetical protein